MLNNQFSIRFGYILLFLGLTNRYGILKKFNVSNHKKSGNELIKIPEEVLLSKIYVIRGEKVMLDNNLAELYGVENKMLKRAVRRNFHRFPDDFMFELSTEEFENLRSQFGTSSWGGTRYTPMAFTEQGVAMLSSVLTSPQAIQVNIQIIRTFSNMRKTMMSHQDSLLRIEKLEKSTNQNNQDIQIIIKALDKLLNPKISPRKKIGFKTKNNSNNKQST